LAVEPLEHRVCLSTTLDTSALAQTLPQLALDGTTAFQAGGPQAFNLAEGDHTVSSSSSWGGSVTFHVDGSGNVTWDPSLNGVLSGAGTADLPLVLQGRTITLDAHALSLSALALDSQSTFPTSTPAAFTVLPGDQFVVATTVWGGQARFTVGPDGTVDYDPSLDGALTGRGTATLVLAGRTITLDAHALSLSALALDSQFTFPTSAPAAFTVLPGDQFVVAATVWGGQVTFTVGADGTVSSDPSLNGVLSGSGTAVSPLVFHGCTITLDATALSLPALTLDNDVGFLGSAPLTVLPGSQLVSGSSGGSISFTVGNDGKIGYDAALDPALAGRGTTTLTVYGFDVSGYTAIHRKYASLGGPQGLLGTALSEGAASDGVGLYGLYANGVIYWTAATGAHEVHGVIRDEWLSLGAERSVLGYPTTDELDTARHDGRYNNFQHGEILWSPATGAHAVSGAIYQDYGQNSWEFGPLGYPTTDELDTARHDGRYNNFQHGVILWSPATGAHAVYGAIYQDYGQNSWEFGPLGYPTTDELDTARHDGRYNNFQHGVILWSPATGAHAVYGAIYQDYGQNSWEFGPLGFPTSDETDTFDHAGRYNTFQFGNIYWSPATAAHEVHGAIFARYAALGYERLLGLPTTDETPLGSYRYNDFQYGGITWDSQNGVTRASFPYTGIAQGNAGTCWILASIAEVLKTGVELSQRIVYLGNNQFRVSLFNPDNPNDRQNTHYHTDTEVVTYDGTRFSADPSSPWSIVLQRAIIQAISHWDPSQTITNPHSGGAADALATITGHGGQDVAPTAGGAQETVRQAWAAGRNVVLHTRGTTSTLVASHAYAFVGMTGNSVTLYNPWGFLVVVSWQTIVSDGSVFVLN
jgi:uncharacterized protein with LGFP repeats